MNTIRSGRKGVTFLAVIAILFILFIAITSYNRMLRDERYQMYRIIYGDNALVIAEAGMDLLQRIVEFEFSQTGYERKNAYFKYEDLIKPKSEFKTVQFDSAKLTSVIAESEPVKGLIEIFGGPRFAKVKKVEVVIDEKNVKYFSDISGTTPNIAPNLREKFGMITYSVQVEFMGVVKTLTVVKQIKIINVLPKALRYFTLFIKNIPKDTDLNKIIVDDSGKPVQGKPLVMQNGDYNKEASPTNLGMIFLGNQPANEPLFLKLSHGDAKGGVGEQFQLLKIFYENEDYKKKFKSKTGMQVGNLQYGVSQGMANSKMYGIRTQNDIMSSMLKLYGTPDDPSPTRVLGNIYRRYLRLAAYQDVPNGKNFMGDIPFCLPQEFDKIGVKPIVENGQPGTEVFPCAEIAKKIIPEDEYKGMQLYREYFDYMNRFIENEYNFSMCTPILDKGGMKCDPNKIPDFKTKLFPDGSNANGGSPAKPADEEFTGSDLRTLALDDRYALPYASYRFKGDSEMAEFKKMFMHDPNAPDDLRLGLAVTFEGDVKLPAMNVQKGGMIICKKGNITISGDITSEQAQNQTLAIIAMDGDVILDAAKADALLISMKDGQKFVPRKAIDMIGTLAVHSMDFDKLVANGGKIVYKTSQTLPNSSPHFYYASIQPDVRNWKVVYDK